MTAERLPQPSTLPRDPMLPQLPQALDAVAMGDVFARLLAGTQGPQDTQGPQLLACEIDRIKYRAQRNCSVLYRLRLRRPHGDSVFEQFVATRFCHGGDGERRWRKALAQGGLRSPAGPALSHLPELDMVAFWLPNDAKLAAPALLADDAVMRAQVLPELVAALTGGRGRLVSQRTTLAQLVPELRLCARVDLELQPSPGAPVSDLSVYVKTDVERSGAQTFALMQSLYDSPARRQGHLGMPRPLLWQAGQNLYWQQAVPGRALQDLDAELAPAMAARVGAQLAHLHGITVSALPEDRVADLQRAARDAAALLGRVEPCWEPLLQRLVGWLQAGAAALDAEPRVTQHGDLHLRNILVDGAQMALIDFDSARRGPAVVELGVWVADMLYRSVLAGTPPQRTAPSCEAFLAGYAQAGGRTAQARLLAWSVVHALLCKRAYRCVANLKPGRFEAVPALLALADAIARRGSLSGVWADAPAPLLEHEHEHEPKPLALSPANPA